VFGVEVGCCEFISWVYNRAGMLLLAASHVSFCWGPLKCAVYHLLCH
jgi:hypothetical protein